MKIERITDLERQYAMQSLDGQFETHNNYKFVVRLEKAFAEKIKWEVVAEPNETMGSMKPSDWEQCKAIADAMIAKLRS